jgi:hypothetical protein
MNKPYKTLDSTDNYSTYPGKPAALAAVSVDIQECRLLNEKLLQLTGKLTKQVDWLKSGQVHPRLSREEMTRAAVETAETARSTLTELEATAGSKVGYDDPDDPFAFDCIECWIDAMARLEEGLTMVLQPAV